ncbi:MAG: Crp/Fnr family transcriptional regulator [Pyrinomonadaceae bacterium]
MNDDVSHISPRLLKNLPADVSERLAPHLERIDGHLNLKLYEPYETITHIYFPVNAIGSIVASTEAGQMAEVGLVGNEGAVGIDIAMGTDKSPHKSMIQIAGPVLRMSADKFLEEFRRAGIFHDRVLSFIQKMYAQVSQTTLCNRLHHVEERLPRWLLMCDDRIAGNVLPLTQEFIALMLGTSRVSVTRAAIDLQDIGYIRYVRGRITILDRAGLEDGSCECYAIVKREYDREYP